MQLVALFLVLAGEGAFAFSMAQQQKRTRFISSSRFSRYLLRIVGTALLAAALVVCCFAFGTFQGVVLWVALLAASGIVVTTLLADHRR